MKDFFEILGSILLAILIFTIGTIAFFAIVFVAIGVPIGAVALIIKLILLIF